MTSQKFNDLLRTLRQLFLFDRADLDFGLYRIMNARRSEIEDFLQNRLLPSVREHLGAVKEEELRQLEKQVEEAIQLTMEYGGKSREDAEQSEKVVKAKVALKEASDLSALEDQVYSLLVTFFSRYYDEGDFITKRRYSGPGRERYMIPYDGEEVKLVWANMDQYYIKSDEFLRDYRFRIPPLEEGQPAPKPEEDDRPTILFKLVAAEVEKDNRKATDGERRFALAVTDENPIELSDDKKLLTIPFSHSAHPKGAKQTDLLEEAERTLLQLGEQRAARQAELLDVAEDAALNAIPESFLSHLRKAVPNKSDPKKNRTLLRVHLDQYAARNTYDYFIHKDLGGFLRRELDYFLKSEVLEIEDMVDQPEEIVRQTLRKTKAVRSIADKIISFLANLEDFQKKLWLKKKFVTEAHYCITLDRIIEHCPELLPEIAANDWQMEEWRRLLTIEEIEGYSEPLTEKFLRSNDKLMVDTGLFPPDFKERLLSSVDQIDEKCIGLHLNADNFGSLALLSELFKDRIKSVYIDPPYNTGEDGFSYKDGFKSASWISFLVNRYEKVLPLLIKSGSVFTSVDDNEYKNLWYTKNQVFGATNYVGSFVWKRRSSSGLAATPLSLDHEYVLCFAPSARDVILSGIARTQDDYPLFDEQRNQYYASTDLTIAATRDQRPNQYFPIKNPRTGAVYQPNPERVWRFFPETMNQVIKDDLVIWPDESEGKLERPRFKTYFNPEEGKARPCSSWIETASTNDKDISAEESEWDIIINKVGMNQEGGRLFYSLFGNKRFSYPKPLSLVRAFVRSALSKDEWMLDYFAGSGTTGHAVISLNRDDGGDRKYVLVEQGEYFSTVLNPRIQKAAYSAGWSNGEPTSRDTGISHCFKYLRLESYEDTLNNLILRRTEAQQAALDGSDSLKDEYLLGYFLEPESAGSMSLLNIDRFSDPWNYKLNIATKTVGETRPQAVDLVETFNYLIGLKVDHIAARRTVRPDRGLTRDEDGQLTVKNFRTASYGDDGSWTFQLVSGATRSGQKTLIIWRTLSGNLEEDNAVLETFLTKLDDSPLKKDWDALYVNGDNTLQNLEIVAPEEGEEAGLPARVFKVRMIEEEFKRRMFAECE